MNKLHKPSCEVLSVCRIASKPFRFRRNQKEIPAPKSEVGNLNLQLGTNIKKTYCKPSEQLFTNRRPLSYPNLTKIT